VELNGKFDFSERMLYLRDYPQDVDKLVFSSLS
jgi:hypothetical protein